MIIIIRTISIRYIIDEPRSFLYIECANDNNAPVIGRRRRINISITTESLAL
jgi:hypothetical protein